MLFGLLVGLWIFDAVILGLLILVQKGKSSIGLGNLGGGAQLLFGGSGGQDLFQKITWFLCALFMGGSLMLAIMKTKQYQQSRYLKAPTTTQPIPIPQPTGN